MSLAPPVSPETVPPTPPPQLPQEAPKSSRKIIIAVVLVVVVVGSSLGFYLWYTGIFPTSSTSTRPSPLYNTYSKYGFSFQYPKGMSISERGLLDSVATSASGIVIGEIDTGNTEMILVGWTKIATSPSLDATLGGAFSGMSHASGVTSVVRGDLVHTTETSYSMEYQYFTITANGKVSYGIYGVWYSTASQRLYQLALTYYSQNTLFVYERYLDSFVEP